MKKTPNRLRTQDSVWRRYIFEGVSATERYKQVYRGTAENADAKKPVCLNQELPTFLLPWIPLEFPQMNMYP